MSESWLTALTLPPEPPRGMLHTFYTCTPTCIPCPHSCTYNIYWRWVQDGYKHRYNAQAVLLVPRNCQDTRTLVPSPLTCVGWQPANQAYYASVITHGLGCCKVACRPRSRTCRRLPGLTSYPDPIVKALIHGFPACSRQAAHQAYYASVMTWVWVLQAVISRPGHALGTLTPTRY